MESTAGLSKDLRDDRYWRKFRKGDWCDGIDVRVRNGAPYTGDECFLVGSSNRTKVVRAKLQSYFAEERKKGARRRLCDDRSVYDLSAGYLRADCGSSRSHWSGRLKFIIRGQRSKYPYNSGRFS